MGCVFILKNRAMPDLIKIGYTMETAQKRADELSRSTGVPMPFEVAVNFVQLELEQCKKLEKEMHRELAEFRVNPRREFFKYPADDAARLLKKLHFSILKELRRPRWLQWIPSF
ncbi:MAG: GIY-YIG nuclease family protein [Candidatus Poribacteria bacterium]|nr:GIY-YIG nuclease family protein [Candidatus Poribacteria bacterium]